MPQVMHIDLTELVAYPVQTGIQRVEREIIRNWPGPARLEACRYDRASQRFVRLPDTVLTIFASEAVKSLDAEREALRPLLENNEPLSAETLLLGLFNPEVFFDSSRANAYRDLCRRPSANVAFLLYDFFPFLRPQDYPPATPRSCMPYIQAIREAPRVSFISEQTQIEYTNRIVRNLGRTGPHFALGGDGLNIEKQKFDANKNLFAYIGTIEPRKNVAVILEAFEALWARGSEGELVIIGRLDSRSARELPILKRLESEARFKHLGTASDNDIREVMRKARATLFVSSAEGFGIPPIESLSAGVPIIVSPGLPCIDFLAPGGRIVLDAISSEAVARAIESTLDDQTASRLWNEASQLAVPTWKDFVRRLAGWLHQ